MQKLSRLIVKYRKLIIAGYILLLIPAIIGYLTTGVNYDLLSYMPDNLNSKQGEEILEKEFALSGLGLMMARDKRNFEIELLIKELENIEGINKISWLGSYSDIYMPREFMDPTLRDRFTTDNTVLLQIQFSENARSERTVAAVLEINAITGADNDLYFGGEPVILTDMQMAIDDEMLQYTTVAVIMILLVLTISTSLYLDPILFLAAVGVAIVINMGSNFFQGEISFLTASIAAVMQLGISLDYAIFLMHRFEEEKAKGIGIEEAMVNTISKTAVTIASSALTTIGGFVALMVMENGIGGDMGLVLGKGIVISLLVTLTLLPGLILTFYPFSSRYRHRVILPSFQTTAKLLPKSRSVILIVFIIIAVPAYLAQDNVEYYYSNVHYLPRNSQAAAATDEIMEEYGAVDVAYLITPDEGRKRESDLVDLLSKVEHFDSVVSVSEQVDPAVPDMMIPEEMISEFQGGGYRNIMVFLSPEAEEKEIFITIDRIREIAGSLHDEYYVAGQPAQTRDMAILSEVDARNVALFSVIAIGLIIAISFRSLSLPLLLVLAVQLAIWINLSFLYYQGEPVSSLTPIIIGAIQLGATVDYAILFTLRYRENLGIMGERIKAAGQTIKDTGRSILTSALILFAATFSISLIAGIKTTREMTLLIGRGALISMVVIFSLLPAMLIVFEKVIERTTIGWPVCSDREKK
ncbi:MAG: MMPL family transporter [Bacillota bacterium]